MKGNFFLFLISAKFKNPQGYGHMQVNSSMLFHYWLWNRNEIIFFRALENVYPIWNEPINLSSKQQVSLPFALTPPRSSSESASRRCPCLLIFAHSDKCLFAPEGISGDCKEKYFNYYDCQTPAQILGLMTRWEKGKQSLWSNQLLLPRTLTGETGFWLELSWMWKWRKVTFKNCFCLISVSSYFFFSKSSLILHLE